MKSMADELAHEHAKPYLDELARQLKLDDALKLRLEQQLKQA